MGGGEGDAKREIEYEGGIYNFLQMKDTRAARMQITLNTIIYF
jgi:hypothetical protein